MKRPNSSKKNTNIKQKQTISLMNMINNILQINSSSKYFHISNFNSITNKTKLFLNKQINNITYYPLTTKKIQELLQEKKNNLFFTTERSQQRKSLRPKSSVCSARQSRASHHVPPNCLTSFNSIQQNCNKSTIQGQQMVRNSSYRFQSNQKPQYQFIHLDNNHIKSHNKCPKSLHSTRNFGIVCGYAVNSYNFIENSHDMSEGRIIIISNLTKNNKSECILSLYCLLQTNKSIQYLDFIRQQLPISLSKKFQSTPIPRITKEFLQDCLIRLQKQFLEKNRKLMMVSPQNMNTNLGLSFAMIFIKNYEVIIATKGQSRIKLSAKLGDNMYGQHSQSLIVSTINIKEVQSLDYICLISEGINKKCFGVSDQYLDGFEINQESHSNKQWFQKEVWKIIINFTNSLPIQIKKQIQQGQYNTIHNLMGLILDALYSAIEKNSNSKNVSILLLGFANLSQMLKMQSDIVIPFSNLHEIDKQIQNVQQKNVIK